VSASDSIGSSDEGAALRRSWEVNASAWTTAVRERAIPSRRIATDDAIVSACSRHLIEKPGARVLDVGCGEGWLSRVLAKRGARVTGIDGSANLIDAARGVESGVTYGVVSYEMLETDATCVPGPFDLVVCNFALLHDRIAEVLRALAKRLTPSGALLLQTTHPWVAVGDGPYEDGWRTESFASFATQFPMTMPWYFRTMGSWLAAARDAELVVERLEEPLNPETRRPLSLLLELKAATRSG
jgi:2-polyprenyl-3-methyl-5-hydroxy-6-metoxy-1,4-benzoquinol methylase